MKVWAEIVSCDLGKSGLQLWFVKFIQVPAATVICEIAYVWAAILNSDLWTVEIVHQDKSRLKICDDGQKGCHFYEITFEKCNNMLHQNIYQIASGHLRIFIKLGMVIWEYLWKIPPHLALHFSPSTRNSLRGSPSTFSQFSFLKAG